jgi:recombination protein RecR
MIPDAIKKFIDAFSRLPSIGPRLATRLAFYLANLNKNDLKNLEMALHQLATINRCEKCFFVSENRLCFVCSNPDRNQKTIAVVEKETDLLSIEQTGKFKGHYFILGEVSPRKTLDVAQRLRLQYLKERILKELGGRAKEIIVALNLDATGDYITQIIIQEFKNLAEKITRLGRGIPTGGEIEFADSETLASALERRV